MPCSVRRYGFSVLLAALKPGAPLARRDHKSNLMLEIKQSYGDVAGAFARRRIASASA